MQTTNLILSNTASVTNKYISLSNPVVKKARKIPNDVRASHKEMLKANQDLKNLLSSPCLSEKQIHEAKSFLKEKQSSHRRLVRNLYAIQSQKRDTNLSCVLSKNPTEFYKSLKREKSNKNILIQELSVGDKTYTKDNISDGFYDSMSRLKTKEVNDNTEQFSNC